MIASNVESRVKGTYGLMQSIGKKLPRNSGRV